ncbi:hypothetical protein B0T11DRAFT_283865 [Plectosphaerella cucumerina]|uniref:DUF7924 domain-containing protein n=1 Tax=Plectosphaerella cucumerina TaxID=40658 RepID=A0A8K0X1F1_9PEZI|nr:hypothetical protein B0T11DRAFT_283865 [Plectosphaerella cucumerina]
MKRQADALDHDHDHDLDRLSKRFRNPTCLSVGKTPIRSEPIEAWARDGQWPREYLESKMERILARKRSPLSRRRPNSATSPASSGQESREEKSVPYEDLRYVLLLQTKGSYMVKSAVGITEESKHLCQDLLGREQPSPEASLFDDDIFEKVCRNLDNKNEARVMQDISRLIVPSAETLAFRHKDLAHLSESVGEGWMNSVPMTGTQPRPDYSVGFKREAFTEIQLAKLAPCIGDIIAGDQSLFMATYYMYFPFLTCEVKCGATSLDTADRQNAHSMTLAVRAVVELFRAVDRQSEVDRQILAFSISHDHRSVRIYGHYAVVEGKGAKYYRHPIRTFDFTKLDGKDKWTAYRFTRNVYDTWVPAHLMRICSAIDQLPEPDLDVASQPGSTLSHDMSLHHGTSDDQE